MRGFVLHIWGNVQKLSHARNLVFYSLLSIAYQVNANFGTCTVVALNGTLVEAKMFTFTLECTHFILSKCPIQTHDGATAKFKVFWKIRSYPILWEPFEVTVPSSTVIGNYAPNCQLFSKAHTALTAPLVLHHTRIGKCMMKTLEINSQLRTELFLIIILHSSLVKAMVNALRLCKLSKICLTGTGHGTMVLTKLFISSFSKFAKGRTRTMPTCQLQRGWDSKV